MILRFCTILMFCVWPVLAQATAPATSARPELRPGTPISDGTATAPAADGATEVVQDAPVEPNDEIATQTATVAPIVVSKYAVPVSMLPHARPGATTVVKPQPSPEPSPKPETTVQPEQSQPDTPVVKPISSYAVAASLRPKKRPRVPRRFLKRISARAETNTVTASAAGSICGVNAIKGKPIAAIAGRIRGCGVSNPVAVTSVSGVRLSTPAKINCNAARALNTWVSKSVKPAVGRLGGGVSGLHVVAHYSCRTRNNQPGAKISEHGRGNAIDIAAIRLKDGNSITVLHGWRSKNGGAILRKIHKQACGTFGTVLGPNSDRFHKDHFHLDVARHRGGAYCR